MKHYFGSIHTKSEAHQKRFALGVSAATTLSIFVIWSFFMFGREDNATLAENKVPISPEVTPFDNLQGGVAASIQALKDQFNNVKGSVKQVDLQSEYEKMRADALKSGAPGTSASATNQYDY